MRRICCLGLLSTTLTLSFLLGCGQQAPPPEGKPPQFVIDPKLGNGARPVDLQQDPAKPPQWVPVEFAAPDGEQDKYDTALFAALNLVAQRKYPEALASLEAAAKFKDTEFVQTEIKKLRLRIEQQDAAEHTFQDIQSVLDQGKFAEAAILANSALKEYGSSDIAPKLVKVKLQADSLSVGQLDNNAAKAKALRDQGQAAAEVGNLRAAVLAYEQSLQFAEDAALRRTYDDLRNKLAKYDDNRQKASELRQDSSNLEDAIELLKAAAKEWDTPQIRQDVDEYTVALQNRRDRIAIADFELRGDVGIPFADRLLAEELLPLFKGKFDLVEREQVAKVLDELKLEAGKLGDSAQDQVEVGKVAKVRFLVLGSVSRLGGIAVNARLVDVRSGLIVQTAKITAATQEEMLARLPELAKLLVMSDQERLVYEQQLVKAAPPVQPVQVQEQLPVAPLEPVAEQPVPPPLIVDAPQPAFGAVKVEQFQQFAPPPPGPPPVLVYGGDPEEAWKRKALFVSLEVGDNLFRRGRYREAQRHFEFGLILSPGHIDLTLRITRCRPFLPPPVVVIVTPPPPRPRIAVVDFVVVGNPAFVPLGLSSWAPQNLAPYFSPEYEIVDRGELFWWMGRMGMTVNDLMVDPNARRWLGRALNVRYFVLGNIVQTNSFDVNTYLIDSEYGYLNGRGFVHCRTPFDLKYRLGELARGTLTPPAQFVQQQQQFQNYDALVVKAQVASGKGDFSVALGFIQQAQVLRPNSIELTFLFNNYNNASKRRAQEEARRREFEQQQAFALQQKLRQEALAREAERQRVLAAQQFAALGAQQRLLQEQKRLADQLAAHQRLVVQADVAFKGGNVKLSIQFYESALNLQPNDDVFRRLAVARAELQRTTQLRAIEEEKLRQTVFARQREEELAAARAKLDAERKLQLQAEAARRLAKEKTDNAEYVGLIDQGTKLMANAKYNAAISTFQAARQLKKTDQVESLLNQALIAQAKQTADAKGAAARKDLEAQLLLEKEARLKAEAAAKLNQDKYAALLQVAQKAHADREYDAAIAKYSEAGKIFQTDAVLTGLKKAQLDRDQARVAAAAAKQKLAEEQTKQANFQKLMAEGQTALLGNDHAGAIGKFKAATNLVPGNVEALTALSKAEAARDAALAAARKQAQEGERTKAFNNLLQAGQANLSKNLFDAAVGNLTEALKLKPGDPIATKTLQLAEEKRAASVKTAAQAAEAKKKTEAYQKLMSDGQLAFNAKRFDDAIAAFGAAQKLLPGDQASSKFLADAQKGKADRIAVDQAAAKKKAEDLQRQTDVQKALDEGQTALLLKDYRKAESAFNLAAKLAPDNPKVKAALVELQRQQAAGNAGAQQAEFNRLMKEGNSAYNAKKWADAVKNFGDAAKLIPTDPQAPKSLKAAMDQWDASKKPPTPTGPTAAQQAEFNRLMNEGNNAYKAQKWADAVINFGDAAKLIPTDPQAPKSLKAATDQWNASKKTPVNPPGPTAAQQAEFNRLMNEGNNAYKAQKWADAVKNFGDAAKLIPTDPQAPKSLKAATDQWNASKKTPINPPGPTAAQVAEYNRQMASGGALDKKQEYEKAMKAYDAALAAIPKDAAATAASRKAHYNFKMAEGNRFLAANRKMEAIREFEAALGLFPKDAAATAGLNKAKALK